MNRYKLVWVVNGIPDGSDGGHWETLEKALSVADGYKLGKNDAVLILDTQDGNRQVGSREGSEYPR